MMARICAASVAATLGAAFALLALSGLAATASPALGPDGAWTRDASRPGVILASEKGKCIYRCRIRREECSQDNLSQSRSDDVCWDGYQTCRSDCGDTSPVGDPIDPAVPPPPGGNFGGGVQADFIQLSPFIIPVGKWLEGITYDGQYIWAAESGQRTVAKIDLNQGRVLERVKVGRLPVDMASMGNGDAFALVHTDQLVWGRNQAGQSTTITKLGECPEAMIEFAQQLWVVTLPDCSSQTSRLTRIDLRNRGATANTNVLGQWAQALVGYDDKIWIAHAREPALTAVDARSMQSRSLGASNASFWTITANSSNIFAGGRVDENNGAGLVVMFDPRREIELARAFTSERIANIISDQEFVVAIGEKGTIWIFSAENLELRRTITLTSGGFDPRSAIFNEDNILIGVGQFQGENGAILVVGNWRPQSFGGGGNFGGGSNFGGGVPVRPVPPISPQPPVVRSGGGGNPSFNCATNRGVTEQAICASGRLSRLDRELASEYSVAVSNITSPAVGGSAADVRSFRNDQRDWISQRDSCGSNERCIASQYRARLQILREMNQPE